MRPEVQLPEPARLWIRYTPRSWPWATGFWTHIGRATLGEGGKASEAADSQVVPSAGLDDVLYLPPLAKGFGALRQEVLEAHGERGTPVLVQLFPGEEAPAGALAVYDPLPKLLTRRLESLTEIPAGSTVVWPLVPGISTSEKVFSTALEAMAQVGVAVVQPLSLALEPVQKRSLATKVDEAGYHALFHRPRPSERRFDRLVRSFGLQPFLPRPLPGPPLGRAANRQLAGLLALAAELWHRLGRSLWQGEELFRAARWIDGTAIDIPAVVREGNLTVIKEIRGAARDLVEEWVDGGSSCLLDQLRQEYLGPAPAP